MNKIIGLIAFTVTFPFILLSSLIIFFHDFKNPFHIKYRVGINGSLFKLYKLRTMRIDFRLTQYKTTSVNDKRIFRIAKYFRKFKIDEFPQFLNVIKGDMEIVGPRPNIIDLVNEYKNEEFILLSQKPGITDISSIILFDLNKLVSEANNPDDYYKNHLRPLKFKMGEFYINNKSFSLNFKIFISTIVSLISLRYGQLILFFLIGTKNSNVLKNILNDEKNNILRSS